MRLLRSGREPQTASALAAGIAALLAAGCVALPVRGAPSQPPPVLHPQVSKVSGPAFLQPRHARDPAALTGPELVEPGDWIETGVGGKVEVVLPQGAVRAYADSRFQILYAFEGRKTVAPEVRVERGEVLVHRSGSAAFPARTEGLQVELDPLSTALLAHRGATHHAACYSGRLEARNVRVRGQTVVWVAAGQHLTLDDAAAVAYLKDEELPDEWHRWEEPDAASAGIAPPPPGPSAAGPKIQ